MKKKIRDFILEELIFVSAPENFTDDDDLFEAGLDSMGIMRLVMFIETEFDITLPDNEIEPQNLRTVLSLEKWVLEQRDE
jgi:acyl carrier protein